MTQPTDARLVPGNEVHCRASLVTSASECKRLFGSAWETEKLLSTAIEVIVSELNGRRQRSVTADWNIQACVKRVTMKPVNVKAEIASGLEEVNLDVSEEETPIQATNEIDTAPVTSPTVTPEENDGVKIEGDSTAHGRTWRCEDVSYPLDGPVPPKTWKVIGQAGGMLTHGNAPRDFSPYDFFMYTFPLMHLSVIVRLTNSNLEEEGCRCVTSEEILKFFGVLLMMTKFRVGNRRDLWSTTPLTKYGPVSNFGRFMSRARFETILSAIRFSSLSECFDELEAPSGWSVVGGFVDAINQHRAQNVTPSEQICVDKSMSRWYELGEQWIDIGLPHYVALDRKSEIGCEIRTAACGQSGMMLRLKIVGGVVDSRGLDSEDEYSASAAATLRLVKPWLRTDRVVCGDSWFASVSTAQALMQYRTRFIGVVKGGTSQFPMARLAGLVLTFRGDYVSMVRNKNGDCMKLLALLWMDRQRRYFY